MVNLSWDAHTKGIVLAGAMGWLSSTLAVAFHYSNKQAAQTVEIVALKEDYDNIYGEVRELTKIASKQVASAGINAVLLTNLNETLKNIDSNLSTINHTVSQNSVKIDNNTKVITNLIK